MPVAESVLRQILESTSDCVLGLDCQWHVTYLNPQDAAELARARDIIGCHILDVCPGLEESPFWPAYQQAMDSRPEPTLANGSPAKVEAVVDGIRQTAHKLAGTSANFDRAELGEVAADVEHGLKVLRPHWLNPDARPEILALATRLCAELDRRAA